MSTEPSFGSGFGSPFGTPGAPGPGAGGPGGAPSGPPETPRSRAQAAPTPWFRRREAVLAGAGLAVAAVLGTVAFVVLSGGGDDDLGTGGGTAAAAKKPTATTTAATTDAPGRVGTRNPFSGQGAVQAGASSGTTSTTAAAASTVYKTVKATVTTTATTTKTTTKTATATVTASPTYVYFEDVTGSDGDATFIVNGTSRGPVSANGTVVTNLKYLGTTGSSPNFCAQVSWKSGTTQSICLGSMARVDG